MCHAYYWHAAETAEEIVEVIQIRNLVCGFHWTPHIWITITWEIEYHLHHPFLTHLYWKTFSHCFEDSGLKCVYEVIFLCLIFVICYTAEVILTAMVSQCMVHIVKYTLCTSELTWNFLLFSSNAVHWFYPKDNKNTSKCRAKKCDDKVCQEGLCHLHRRNLQVQARETPSIYTHGMWA